MEKKELIKSIRKILKEKGFDILKNNKYVIEYAECYIVLWLSFYNGFAELNYNISFKAIHKIINKNDELKKWSNCDFNEFPKLNNFGDVDNNFQYSLLDLPNYKLSEEIEKMLKLYIEPFNNSFKEIIEFINKGRIYKHPNTKQSYVEPYYFLPQAKEFLLQNGMRPIEEFFE